MNPAKSREAGRRSAWILGVLAAYLVVSAFCYYDGFFRFVAAGNLVWFNLSGLDVLLDDGRASTIPWARIPILIGTAYALVRAARAVREGDPRARLACFAVSFGLLLPQASLLLVYMTTLRNIPLFTAAPIALLVTGLPALAVGRPGLLHRFDAHEDDAWSSLAFGQRRLLLTLVTLGWLGFLAEIDVAWTAGHHGLTLNFAAAVAAMALAAVSAVGLLRLRVWALCGAVATAGLVTVSALGFAREVGAQGCACSTAAAWLPVGLVLALTWPFWRSLGARLRETA